MDRHGSHVSIEFMWICKQNDVQLVFLSPHSLHVLQPLDLAVFSSMKAHYRRTISDLAYLDDAAPIKKQLFIHAYAVACEKALIPVIIKNGWRASGIDLYNSQSGLNFCQVRRAEAAWSEPTSPLQQITSTVDLFNSTPRNHQHFKKVVKHLKDRKSVPKTAVLNFLAKASKAVAQSNASAAEQKATIYKLTSRVEKLGAFKKSKKAVRLDTNTKFASIEDIIKAQEKTKAVENRLKARDIDKELHKNSDAAAQATLDNMIVVWQAYQIFAIISHFSALGSARGVIWSQRAFVAGN